MTEVLFGISIALITTSALIPIASDIHIDYLKRKGKL